MPKRWPHSKNSAKNSDDMHSNGEEPLHEMIQVRQDKVGQQVANINSGQLNGGCIGTSDKSDGKGPPCCWCGVEGHVGVGRHCPRSRCSKEAHRVDDPLVESTESHTSTTLSPANMCGSGLNALYLSSLSILQRITAQLHGALTWTLVISSELMHMTAW